MKRLILLILLVNSFLLILGQEVHCFMSDSIFVENNLPMQIASTSTCNDKLNYTVYPDYNMTPIKTLRVSFDVIQKTDGSGSYLGTDAQITDFFQKLIDASNQLLANLQIHAPSVTSNYITDSRVRLKLSKVHFFKNDIIYNVTSGASDYSNAETIYNNYVLQRTDLDDLDKNHTLHIIMEPILQRTPGGQARGLGDRRWVVLRGYDASYNNELQNSGSYLSTASYFAHHLVHEVGHSLGLYHVFDYSDCNVSDYGCNSRTTTNNYMDYPNYITTNWASLISLTEYQVSRIHYTMMGYLGSISQNYIQDYCFFDNNESFSVDSNRDILWSNSRNLAGNVSVSGRLSIKCRVSLPKEANIFVLNGGVLTLDQGVLDNSCGDDWTGIVVRSGGLLVLNATTLSDYNITVECGGTIVIKGLLNMSGNHCITVQSGGFICIENGTVMKLSDYNSLIKINDGALIGVNPTLAIQSNCVSLPTSIAISGAGSIIDYSQDVYIQNQTISSNKYIGGKNIFVGNHVTTSQTAGDVLINNGANVIFDCKNIVFDPGFECAFGSTYEVKNH